MKSMTGYGSSLIENEQFNIEIEMKSVNHRYADITIRGPKVINFLETSIKKQIQKYIKRGKIDCYIRLNIFEEEIDIEVNEKLALNLYEKLSSTWDNLNINPIFEDKFNVGNLMNIPNFINYKSKKIDENILKDEITKCLNLTINRIVEMKQLEGDSLKNIIEDYLELIVESIKIIENNSKNVVDEYRNKITKKVKEFIEIDQNITNDRLAMEIVLFADKIDISEEIVRMNSHINQFYININSNNEIGKKLDYILQEMNREANTIGSKTNNILITNEVINLKTIIEKIKEQIQNIE